MCEYAVRCDERVCRVWSWAQVYAFERKQTKTTLKEMMVVYGPLIVLLSTSISIFQMWLGSSGNSSCSRNLFMATLSNKQRLPSYKII